MPCGPESVGTIASMQNPSQLTSPDAQGLPLPESPHPTIHEPKLSSKDKPKEKFFIRRGYTC
jgi:hypothetical protein